ncbi:hypothetical protein [Sphingomonas nostoxanthinifaciens]|uniref:hypothetical protein n=1 Tax=Sphingomonas nostoxanthinifaciens TaxID=2872652 RepID=UPI001CC21110|nr:hypothetical protein [Sphingomonas nostoxanthinifaciens]UAK22862.1 hypothetical protein K8P63_10440 [Sphingomonas nostoxanthinifaciens]
MTLRIETIPLALLLALIPAAAAAQMDPHAYMDMPGMDDRPAPPPAKSSATATPPAMDMAPMHDGQMSHDGQMPADMPMAAMEGHAMAMPATLGPFAMNREASGTAWQPESSPLYATMIHAGSWMAMAQGNATLVYDNQGGPRGDTKTFVESMAMLMAARPVGDHGRFGLRAMLSLDPVMGAAGYPLLFATGETANGRTELVDRQHPHDLFMELAASYAHDIGEGRALYLYAGLPGEPALGPPTFMHRISGMDNPEAPIGHHWFDSTHITWGVVTGGFSTHTWKIEASAFKGREPDQYRWDAETPALDSWSVRIFWNPTRNLSLQASTGFLHSPEQLHPEVNEQRTTASASYNLPLGPGANWASTVAWSIKNEQPGPALNGWLAESALRWADRHTVFARVEREDESELFDDTSPLHGQVIPVNKMSLGYQYELSVTGDVRLALGGLVSAYAYPQRLVPTYGGDGVKSFMLYTRVSLGDRRIR